MDIKQEFLKLAGLDSAVLVVEAEEQKKVEFAKNSSEVAAVKMAVRKAIRHCEEEASKVKSPNLRKTYEGDAETYDYILGLINANRQATAMKSWSSMDTAARDVVFDVTTDKDIKRLIAAYFGTTLLHEGEEDSEVKYVVVSATENSELADVITKVSSKQELKNLIKAAHDEPSSYVVYDEDEKDAAYAEAKKRIAAAKGEKVDEAAKSSDEEGDGEEVRVVITSGKFKGYKGHLSYDEDGTEWVTFNSDGHTRDVQAKWEKISEAVNHMGEREYQTYAGWKTACKKAHPGCGFRGDKDIGAATLDGKDVGEWDGAVGSVFNKVSESAETYHTKGTKVVNLAGHSGVVVRSDKKIATVKLDKTGEYNDYPHSNLKKVPTNEGYVGDVGHWYIVNEKNKIGGGPYDSAKEAKSDTKRLSWYKEADWDIEFGHDDGENNFVKSKFEESANADTMKYFNYEYSWEDKGDDPQEHSESGTLRASSKEEAERRVKNYNNRIINMEVSEISKEQFDKVDESAEIKVVDIADTVKDETTDNKADKAKIPAEVTKALKDKIKELENEIKYTSHLQSQEQQIVNLNGAVRVMNDILELMDKGCEESMKKIAILLTALEGPQKVMVPKEVWKFMAVDYANPLAKKISLADRFKAVKTSTKKD